MPFQTPNAIYVTVGTRWWRLKPSKFRSLARRVTADPLPTPTPTTWTYFGRVLKGRPRGLPDDDPKRPILRPEGWQQADWFAALDAMDLREERFTWGAIAFDITAAKAIATAADLPVQRAVPTEDWWAGSRKLIRVLPARVKSVKLDKPVIMATLVDAQGPFQVLIDGNHRATKGLEQGLKVPYVVLDVRLTLKAMENTMFVRSIRRRMQAHLRTSLTPPVR